MADFINRAAMRSLGIEALGKIVFGGWPSGSLQNGIVQTDGTPLNVRVEPIADGTHGVISGLLNGSSVTVIGRSVDGQWLAISYNDTIIGWVSAEFVGGITDIVSLPVYTSGDIDKLIGQ